MTDRNKFEQMLEHLINDEQDKAQELFHQIVVAKSREIYENILAEDFEDLEESEKDEDEEVEEAKDEDDEEKVEENFSFAEGGDEEGDIGGDATDDFIDDVDAEGDDEEGGEEGEGDEDLEDRVVDLEDALDDLRAEFEALMADEEGEGEHNDGESDPMFGGDDEEMEDSLDPNFMREYVEKVATPKGGDNGANAKSVVAGKNDMGGTTANIAKGGESKSEGTKGGLLNPSTKEDNAGNINVPGGKAGSAFSKKEPGHGAEKKGAGESADNKKSVVGGK